MTADALVVAVLAVLCFAAGLAGGRRIASSIMAPVSLLFLSIVGNHSEIASVPPWTAFFTTFGWVAGVFVFVYGVQKNLSRVTVRDDDATQDNGGDERI